MAWGSYPRFVAYTAKLLRLLPPTIVPALAFGATAAETLFGLLLVLGEKTRLTSLLSGAFDLVAAKLVRRYVTERPWGSNSGSDFVRNPPSVAATGNWN
ncbi:DoxX family protein [Candidatus Binatus sp.]|uniref:DoxX family protein n=1 Tax=Candidatus Binatus sp. TaxID=2811406 RepID=UPI003C6EC355